MHEILDVLLHLNKYLNEWAGSLGPWLYVVLFLVVFAETGLVVTPFLPGDSLLFAVGALAARDGSPINLVVVIVALIVAAILGDAVNYLIGARIGPRIFHSQTSRLLNKQHLLKAQAFYEKYGGKTIVLARFVPIVRTFAPFVAGIGKMPYSRFALFNVVGAIAWVLLLCPLGYAFGSHPFVEKHFEAVILAIVVISVLPIVVEWVRARRQKKAAPGT